MSDNVSAINRQFIEDVKAGSGSEEYEKTAAEVGGFLLDKMRERCFSDRIIPIQPIGANKLIPSKNHDTPVFLDFIEPDSQAVALTFRGRPDVNYVFGDRYEIPFFTIASLEYEKAIQELMVYPYPILRVIEKNVVRDMDGIKDYYFMTFVEDAVSQGSTLSGVTGQYSAGRIIRGEEATAAFAAAGGFDGTRGEIQRNDLIELGKIFSRSRRPKGCLLMALPDWDNVAKWTIEDFGDGEQGRITFKGLGEGNIGVGKEAIKVVHTIKVDIVQEGNIYMFTPPEWLGRNFLLNAIEFWAKKERNMVRFGGWFDCGMGIGNIASTAKLELYNAASSDLLPAEAAIGGGVFNQVAAGLTFPTVNNY